MAFLDILREAVIDLRVKQKALTEARRAVAEARVEVAAAVKRRDELLSDVEHDQGHLPFETSGESATQRSKRSRRKPAV